MDDDKTKYITENTIGEKMNTKNIILAFFLVILVIGVTYTVTASKFNEKHNNEISFLNETHGNEVSNLNKQYETQLNSLKDSISSLEKEKSSNEEKNKVVLGLFDLLNKQNSNIVQYTEIFATVKWTSSDSKAYEKLYELNLKDIDNLKNLNSYTSNNRAILEEKLTKDYISSLFDSNEKLTIAAYKNSDILKEWTIAYPAK